MGNRISRKVILVSHQEYFDFIIVITTQFVKISMADRDITSGYIRQYDLNDSHQVKKKTSIPKGNRISRKVLPTTFNKRLDNGGTIICNCAHDRAILFIIRVLPKITKKL